MKLIASLLIAGLAAPAVAADWPQFRGPHRDGHSPDKHLLKVWPEDGPRVAWKSADVGEGFSSVAVVGDTVVTMGDKKDGCHVVAVGRKDGKAKWSMRIGEAGGGGGYPGPRCTPTVNDGRVYALGQHGNLVCLSLADGSVKWTKNLPKDFKGSSGGWQYSESPLVDGDKLICTPGGPKATMVALSTKDGSEIWAGRSPDNDSAGYASPIVSNAGGVKQYVTLTSKGLVSFDAKSGDLLWRYGNSNDRFRDNTANIPTPVLLADPNLIFAAAGYGRGAALIKVAEQGGKLGADEVYWKNALNNKHGGIVRVGDYVYGDADDSGRIWCAKASNGEVQWRRKDEARGAGSASIAYADGMLYVRFQNGWVSLIHADPSAYKLASTFRVPNGTGNCWAHPAVIDGKFYVRERGTIWCYDVAAE